MQISGGCQAATSIPLTFMLPRWAFLPQQGLEKTHASGADRGNEMGMRDDGRAFEGALPGYNPLQILSGEHPKKSRHVGMGDYNYMFQNDHFLGSTLIPVN